MRTASAIGWTVALLTLCAAGASCTIEDVRDEIRVVEVVPPPSSAGAAHRLSRSLGLGGDADRVDRGEFTFVRLRVLSPEDSDLFPFLRISIYARTSEERSLLAEGTDFERGERERDLDIQFTSDIKPFLRAADLDIEWDIFYKSSEVNSYPRVGIELETVIGFSIDVEII